MSETAHPTVPDRSTADVPEAATRLRDLSFSDLYFSDNYAGFYRPHVPDEGAAPLQPLPADVAHDLTELKRKVIRKGNDNDEFFVEHDDVRYRVAKIADDTEVWFCLRKAMFPVPALKDLQIKGTVNQYLLHLGYRSGLLLFVGATGSGKTTTACSLLTTYLAEFGDLAVTLEDPPEIPLGGDYGDDNRGKCFQKHIKHGDFGPQITRTMRYNPRYIMLGEVRSPSDASEAVRAAINGHLVISTFHAGDPVEALDGLIKLAASTGEDVELVRNNLARGLAGVVSQSLKTDSTKALGYRVRLKFLFPGNEQGVRNTIAQGNIGQLNQTVDRQMRRVKNQDYPTDL